MADRGFDIKEDMLDGVSLNIPPFLNGCTQLSLLMMKKKTRKIAAVEQNMSHMLG